MDQSQQLEQCVAYFTAGGPFEWIIGGLFVVVLVVFAFTKKNFVSLIAGALRAVLNSKEKK